MVFPALAGVFLKASFILCVRRGRAGNGLEMPFSLLLFLNSIFTK